MKRLLIVLSLCLVFSSSVYAKKPMIKSVRSGGLSEVVGTTSCEYSFMSDFSANLHAHKGMAAELKVLVDNEAISLYSMGFSETADIVPCICPGPFYIDMGKDWSLVWVLESTRGQGHIIDAVEMVSGTCAP